MIFTREASAIFNIKGHAIGRAYSMGNTGMIYAKQGNDEIAEVYLREPIEILEEFGRFLPGLCLSHLYGRYLFQKK